MSQLKEGNGQPDYWEEPYLSASTLKPRGFRRMANTGRMSLEVHVRICGGLVVRFLRSTRWLPLPDASSGPTHEDHWSGGRCRRHQLGGSFRIRSYHRAFLSSRQHYQGHSTDLAKPTSKPVMRGIMLALGLSFIMDAVNRMRTAPVLTGIAPRRRATFSLRRCPSVTSR